LSHTEPAGRPVPVLVAEHTPNPHAVRILVDLADVPESGAEFASLDEARTASPLAAALFELGGVDRVFITPAFVAITKSADAEWRGLGERVLSTIKQQIASGQPAVRADAVLPAELSRADDEDVARRIREAIECDLRPLVAAHGGDVALAEFRDGVAVVTLRGACAGCPAAELTLRLQLETRLKQRIPEVREVVSR